LSYFRVTEVSGDKRSAWIYLRTVGGMIKSDLDVALRIRSLIDVVQ
jgi:hypothetical protein